MTEATPQGVALETPGSPGAHAPAHAPSPAAEEPRAETQQRAQDEDMAAQQQHMMMIPQYPHHPHHKYRLLHGAGAELIQGTERVQLSEVPQHPDQQQQQQQQQQATEPQGDEDMETGGAVPQPEDLRGEAPQPPPGPGHPQPQGQTHPQPGHSPYQGQPSPYQGQHSPYNNTQQQPQEPQQQQLSPYSSQQREQEQAPGKEGLAPGAPELPPPGAAQDPAREATHTPTHTMQHRHPFYISTGQYQNVCFFFFWGGSIMETRRNTLSSLMGIELQTSQKQTLKRVVWSKSSGEGVGNRGGGEFLSQVGHPVSVPGKRW